MSIQIVNKGIDVSAALQTRISDRVGEGIGKYFDRPGEAYVVIERDGRSGFKVHCSLHLPTGTLLQTSANDNSDAYVAADEAMEKLETRLRRYKRKLRNHHKGKRLGKEAEEAMYAVLQAGRTPLEPADEHDDDATPEAVVVSERMGELRSLSVSMAVMDMDISDAQVLLFRNIANGEINALYRRPDGHIGWMNPQKSVHLT